MSNPAARAPVVLVIDDEPVIRDFIAASLGGHGIAVLGAASGGEALRLARAHEADIRLALIELCLPHLGGESLGGALREARPGLRCGYITWGVGASAAPLLRKPFNHSGLVEFVGRLLAADDGRSARPG